MEKQEILTKKKKKKKLNYVHDDERYRPIALGEGL